MNLLCHIGNQRPGPWLAQQAQQGKSLNLGSDEARAAYWRAFEAEREKFYPWAEKRIRRQFERERRDVIAAIESGVSVERTVAAIDQHVDRWKDLLRDLYTRVGSRFAQRTNRQLDKPKDFARVLQRKAYTGSPWLQGLQQYIIDHALDGADDIAGTTKDRLKETLLEGIDNNETIDQIARRIEREYEGFSRHRALLIARTEIIAASNAGSQAAARAKGFPLEKEWIATHDERTRWWHAEANGQRRPIDEPYVVRGEHLMFPGDDSLGASGDNVIACRCVEAYSVV